MKGPLLVIDAATYHGTVAVVDGHSVRAQRDAMMRGESEERLMPAVAATLADCALRPADLAGVVCGAGPGSFTSLRIAASIGKALATAASLPLMSVSSVLLIVAGQDAPVAPGRYLAMLDAMRGDVFASRCLVRADGCALVEAEVELVTEARAGQIAADEGRTMVGPRSSPAWFPHARGVARLADPAALTAADLTSWEPSYGRLAEAQVKWERAHGRRLSA
jgi:tRNA threonylcarbamoyladenosine biosynthesis protein TsaB